MKSTLIALIGAATAALCVLAGCKKDDSTVTANYLDGSVSYTIPAFVAAGDVLDVTPTGVSHPDGDPYGYYWYVETLKTKRDTSKSLTDDRSGRFTYEIPDTIGTFTLSVSAYATDYYPSTRSRDFTILHPTRSLTETGIEAADPSFTDTRDGQRYAYTTVAGTDWMRENLAWAGAGVSYDRCPAADPVFGRYYSWEEAKSACPSGWHLPTDAEWTALVSAASGASGLAAGADFATGAGLLMAPALLNTEKLWEFWPEVEITDAAGFCALPLGYGNLAATATGSFTGLKEYAVFWTADAAADPNLALYRYLHVRRPEVYLGAGDRKAFVASVRCVR